VVYELKVINYEIMMGSPTYKGDVKYKWEIYPITVLDRSTL